MPQPQYETQYYQQPYQSILHVAIEYKHQISPRFQTEQQCGQAEPPTYQQGRTQPQNTDQQPHNTNEPKDNILKQEIEAIPRAVSSLENFMRETYRK